ncbi:C-type lectin domain family 4 member F [Orchesella cincta]|uniref:C-type lectin domain family 4 member F n=1 Tax=Orchesella cincta TaxID=48709 RepID=A0A1D2MA52_ORCCI|nr:C-type lectin domain family 4 member F [Orchesella cincta]
MKVVIIHCIIMQALFFLSEAAPTNITGDISAELVYLGFVDGKNYFTYEMDQSWFEARTLCQDDGLILASITSDAQLAFLKSQTVHAKIWGHEHWIGARDAQLPRALSYDDTGMEPPTLTGIEWIYRGDDYSTCGAYNPGKSSTTPDPDLIMFPCVFGRPFLCSTL